MTAKNKVGLEAEFFLRKDGELVFPGDYGFSTDEFIILGEFRADPGTTRGEAIANFYKVYYDVVEKAKAAGLLLDISTGYTTVTPEKYAKVMRRIGHKNVAGCNNIYPDVDMLKLTDAVVVKGEIKAYKLSTGLHVHFSSSDVVEKVSKRVQENFSPVKIPISIGGVNAAEMSLYQKTSQLDVEDRLVASANRITKPVLISIIESMDADVFSMYEPDETLKYRKPGFYELKDHGGFEYRSLPFCEVTLTNIYNIVDYSFTQLEALDL